MHVNLNNYIVMQKLYWNTVPTTYNVIQNECNIDISRKSLIIESYLQQKSIQNLKITKCIQISKITKYKKLQNA